MIVPGPALIETLLSTGALPYPATTSVTVSDAASVIGPLPCLLSGRAVRSGG